MEAQTGEGRSAGAGRRCRELEDKLSWLETKPAPNDWGEYPPEFPREGM